MKKNVIIKYWLPVIVYAAAIFSLSSIPQIPAPYLFSHSDKVLHFIEYAGFGFLILRALNSSEKSSRGENLRMLAFLLAFFYGATDEIHQYFVPGRNMQLSDVLSDALGGFVGQWLFKINK